MTVHESADADDTIRGNPPTGDDLIRVVDRGPLGFVVTNDVGVIEWINETLLVWLGYSRRDMIGRRTFQELLAPGGRIYYDTHVRPLVHMQRVVQEIAVELVCADHSRLPVLISTSLRTDVRTGREIIETFVIDATKRRSYETEILRERQSAERSEARLRTMYDVVSGLTEAVTVEEIVAVVTSRGRGSVNGSRCAVWLFESDLRRARRVGHDPDGERDGERDREGETVQIVFPEGGPALDQLDAGEVVVITDRQLFANKYPLICSWLEETGLQSAAVAPLTADGRLFGAISYGFAEPHEFEDAELHAAQGLAGQAEQALRRARLLDAERLHKDRLERLLEFSAVLSGALTLDEVIDALVDGGKQLIGAVGIRVALLDDSGTTARFVRGSGVGGRLDISIPLEGRSIGCHAIRTGTTVVTNSRQELANLFPASPILDHPSFGRVMAVPLRRGDQVLGAWVLAFSESGLSDADDDTLLGLFAEQAGQATQRAALHQAESLARAQADVRHQVSEALNGALTTSDVGRAITVEGRAAFDARALAVFLVDPNTTTLHLEAHSGLGGGGADAASTGVSDASLAQFLTDSSPRFADVRVDSDDFIDEVLGSGMWEAAAILPLGIGGQLLGLVVIGFDRRDALSSSTRVALSGLTAEASVALARARRHDLDHDVATTLQASLLSTFGALGSGWEVSTSYEPWNALLEVGGDMFDATPLDDGRLALVVGDVVGHGLEAAAAMGLLRSAAKALTLVTTGPAQVIEGLQSFAQVTPGVMYSSICCIEVQPDGTGRYACAGHPFPILRHRDGRTEILDEARSPLLGVGHGQPDEAAFALEVGSTLVMYTDGLIERRDAGLDEGIDKLCRYMCGADPAAGELSAAAIVNAMLSGRENQDDVVVMCLTRTEVVAAPMRPDDTRITTTI